MVIVFRETRGLEVSLGKHLNPVKKELKCVQFGLYFFYIRLEKERPGGRKSEGKEKSIQEGNRRMGKGEK